MTRTRIRLEGASRKAHRRLLAGVPAFLVALAFGMGPALVPAAPAWAVPQSGASASWWKKTVAEVLENDLPRAGERVEILDLNLPAALTDLAPGDGVSLAAPAAWARSSRVSLVVDLLSGPASGRRLWISARVRVPANLPVAARRLARGQSLDEYQVTFVEMDLLDLRGREPIGAEDLAGEVRTRRAVVAGDVLTTDMVERTPVVRQGQRISLIVEGTGLLVRTMGIARKTAARGEIIPVSNADTGKIVDARVVDRQTAVVEMASRRKP